MPVMRPLWMSFPDDSATFAIEKVYTLGHDLLVAPVTEAGKLDVECYFPGSDPWYDIETGMAWQGPIAKVVAAPYRKIPAFQRGGSILPRKMRSRRASTLMHGDPFTLNVAVDATGHAEGHLFVDDYVSYKYSSDTKAFAYFKFQLAPTSTSGTWRLTGEKVSGAGIDSKEWIERVTVVGLGSSVTAVKVLKGESAGAELTFTTNTASGVLTIKKPTSSERWMSEGFEIEIVA